MKEIYKNNLIVKMVNFGLIPIHAIYKGTVLIWEKVTSIPMFASIISKFLSKVTVLNLALSSLLTTTKIFSNNKINLHDALVPETKSVNKIQFITNVYLRFIAILYSIREKIVFNNKSNLSLTDDDLKAIIISKFNIKSSLSNSKTLASSQISRFIHRASLNSNEKHLRTNLFCKFNIKSILSNSKTLIASLFIRFNNKSALNSTEDNLRTQNTLRFIDKSILNSAIFSLATKISSFFNAKVILNFLLLQEALITKNIEFLHQVKSESIILKDSLIDVVIKSGLVSSIQNIFYSDFFAKTISICKTKIANLSTFIGISSITKIQSALSATLQLKDVEDLWAVQENNKLYIYRALSTTQEGTKLFIDSGEDWVVVTGSTIRINRAIDTTQDGTSLSLVSIPYATQNGNVLSIDTVEDITQADSTPDMSLWNTQTGDTLNLKTVYTIQTNENNLEVE